MVHRLDRRDDGQRSGDDSRVDLVDRHVDQHPSAEMTQLTHDGSFQRGRTAGLVHCGKHPELDEGHGGDRSGGAPTQHLDRGRSHSGGEWSLLPDKHDEGDSSSDGDEVGEDRRGGSQARWPRAVEESATPTTRELMVRPSSTEVPTSCHCVSLYAAILPRHYSLS